LVSDVVESPTMFETETCRDMQRGGELLRLFTGGDEDADFFGGGVDGASKTDAGFTGKDFAVEDAPTPGFAGLADSGTHEE